MRNLKRQLQQMVKSAAKGKRGGKSPSQQPASSSSASLPQPSSQTNKQKDFVAMRKVESSALSWQGKKRRLAYTGRWGPATAEPIAGSSMCAYDAITRTMLAWMQRAAQHQSSCEAGPRRLRRSA